MMAASILKGACSLRLEYVYLFITRIVITYMLVLYTNSYIETDNPRQICDWYYALSITEMQATNSHMASILAGEN
jgi:hypothetical protein